MRVLILWAGHASANLGVRTLAEGTAAFVRRVWPEAECVVADYGQTDIPRSFRAPRSMAKEWLTGREGLREWVRDFDLVVDTRSGDSFADIYGMHRLLTMSAMGLFVRRNGVPLVMGPQTIGPFDGVRGRALGRLSLRAATTVFARDPDSATCAARMGRPVDALTTDVVFALPQPETGMSRDVLFNISGLLWHDGPHVDAEHYRATAGHIYRGLVERGRRVTLFAHVLDNPSQDNDVAAIADFVRVQGGDVDVFVPGTLAEARQAVAGANVVVGSRMHACLNALSVGTPAVPLAYSRKFEPLLAALGWSAAVDLRTDQMAADSTLRLVEEPMAPAVRRLQEQAQELLGAAEPVLRASL